MGLTKRLLRGLFIVVLVLLLVTAGGLVATQTTWFKNWLRGYVVREASQYLNGQLSIGRLGGNIFFGIELENVRVSMDGEDVVSVKDVGVAYNAFELIGKGLVVRSIRLDRPVVRLARRDGTWSIGRLVRKERQEADRTGPGRPVTIGEIGVSNGSLVFDDPLLVPGVEIPRRIDRLDARFAFRYEPVRYHLDIAHVSFRGSEPSVELNALSGSIVVQQDDLMLHQIALRTSESSIAAEGVLQHYLSQPTFKMRASSDKLSLEEIGRVVPALAAVRVQPAFELALDGPLDRLAVDVNARSSAGELNAQLLADALDPQQSIRGTVSIRHLDLAPFLATSEAKSDVTAVVAADLQGASLSDIASLRGSATVDAPRVAIAGYVTEHLKAKAVFNGRHIRLTATSDAYGASASVDGALTLSPAHGSAIYDLAGRVRHVNLARLPRTLGAPSADTNLNASYRASGDGTAAVRARLIFEDSDVPGAHIAPKSMVGFSAARRAGSVSVLGYQADLTASRLDVQRLATAFAAPALAADSYKTSLNAHLKASGSGSSLATARATLSGELTDSTVWAGHIPQLSFEATVDGDAAHVRAHGAFEHVDPGVASGRTELRGDVAGSLDADASLTNLSAGVGIDRLDGTATVIVQRSEVGGLRIDDACLDAAYHQQILDIRTLDLTGPDVKMQASGTVALAPSGESHVVAHAESTNLEQLGAFVHVPLTGLGKVDATITGNQSQLTASGTITGNELTYSGQSALTLSADYKVDLPNLSFHDVILSATTTGTFVTVGGQHVNEVTAKTRYQNEQLDVDLTAKQPQRSLNAVGTVLFHPDNQELRLTRLDLTAQNVRWQLAPSTAATVRYGNGQTVVTDLRLVSGVQQIAADGTFGKPGEPLTVRLTKVDLANLDALLLRPAQFSGALDASGTISGTTAAPQANATFEIAGGGFGQFQYQSFAGTVGYNGKGVTIDSRLEQTPTAFVHVHGYAPLGMFRAASGDGSAEPTSTRDAEPIDLHVESSPVNLGVVQGFTTMLSAVKGTAQANVQVTGAAGDPRVDGSIDLVNGSFKVTDTGVAYAHLNGRIELQDDRVHIAEFTILDNADASLSLTGDMSFRSAQTERVSLQVTARDFKVLDNKLGTVRINSDLSVAGDVRAPRVAGDLGISTGTINLDPILAATGQSAYAVTPVENPGAPTAATRPGGSDGRSAPAATSAGLPGFEAVQMDVRMTVPDDLVVKGSDLRVPGAPIGLGAVNVTLGGNLRALKDSGGSVRLVGTVNTIRGGYDFQGRQFTILRDGLIRFEGTEALNPTLDVKTQRLIQGVQANVSILGTMQDPRIELTSVPPLEQADILSLIVFNQPVNELGEGQQISLGQRAEQMAVGAIAGELSKSLGSVLNLSEFEIQTAPESGATAQLTVGQQIGQNLYIKLQQGVGDVSTTNFILEYELNKWLRLRTNVIQATAAQQALFQAVQDSGFDLIFFFNF